MYLIDSSVWIEYLRPKGSAALKERVRDLLFDSDFERIARLFDLEEEKVSL